jgi:hypothetical protein
MLKQLLLSGLAIIIALTVLDILMRRLFLRAVCDENAGIR